MISFLIRKTHCVAAFLCKYYSREQAVCQIVNDFIFEGQIEKNQPESLTKEPFLCIIILYSFPVALLKCPCLRHFFRSKSLKTPL